MMQTSILKIWPRVVLGVMLLAMTCGNVCLRAQEGCAAPAPPPRGGHDSNIFNEQQEADLGDAMAEHLQRNFRVSSDEQLAAYLRQIATRLLKHMSPMELRLQFFLVDLPDANAFNLPGGRIYVSPKIVALVQNEDELAAVVAHELGHLAAHQSAIEMTRELAEVLKITQVSDRRDIFAKYHQLIENSWRKPGALRQSAKEREEKEWTADRLALYAMAGAGYSVHSFADMFDRTAGTEGKTGNWFSDVFGSPNPESKRLREMILTMGAMPEKCIESSPQARGDDFKAWQAAVIDYSGWSKQEVLHDVLNKTKLDPPLRGEIRHLKFSPDGKYILAQDEGNIYVLTREPFAPLFQIDAPDAAHAQFSPDSSLVVFHNRHLRVETWDIATRKRTSAHELIEREGCLQSNLSPDGKTLACLEGQRSDSVTGPDLVLFDVATGGEVCRKTSFDPDWAFSSLSLLLEILLQPDFMRPFDRGFIFAGFTPDARYFLAVHEGRNLLVDLNARQEAPIPKPLSKHLTGRFAFLDAHRIVVINGTNPAKSHVLAFPSGEVLSEVALGGAELAAATHGDYAIVRPVQDYPVGVIDLALGKHIFAYKHSALDVFDQIFVVEERDGELGFHGLHAQRLITKTTLPGGHLGALRAAAVSPDWKWLAASEEGRGGVWDLDDGNRLYHIRGFQGAYFPNSYVLYTDLPKFNDTPRCIAAMSLIQPLLQNRPPIEDKEASQHGEFLVVTKSPDKSDWTHPGAHQTLEIRDVTTGATLWSKEFPKEGPSYTVDTREQRMVVWWPASRPQAKDEMQNFPAVSDRLSGRKEKGEAYFLETLDAHTGKVLGAIAVEAPKNRSWGMFHDLSLAPHTSGDWVAVSGGENNVLVYSLSSGNEIGRYFGHDPVLSAAGGLLSVENEPGHLTLYDLNSGQDLDRWVFSSPISLREFSLDGKHLFVLTADQTAYVLDVSAFARTSLHP